MKHILKNIIKHSLPVIICVLAITSCNKTLERFGTPLTVVQNTQTINNFLTTDTSYSLLNALVIRAGMAATLSDVTTSFTFFAPNNAALRATPGFTTTALINALPVTTAQSIVSYLLVPGKEYTFAEIPTTFPNIQLPTTLGIGANLPGTTIPIKMSIFPSKRGTTVWVNNVPAVSFDMHFLNGIVHTISSIASPPSVLLAAVPTVPATANSILYADPQLTMFDSLILRADQAVPSANLDAALKNAGANLTVFAPTNAAVKAFINAASGGAVPLAAPDATFFAFIRTSLPASSAQGIVLYHIMGVRAFSVNFPATATLFPTLLNSGVPTHPGVSVQAFFKPSGGLTVDSLKVIGAANGGIPATSKPATNFDKLAINGIVHIIDRVLLPQ